MAEPNPAPLMEAYAVGMPIVLRYDPKRVAYVRRIEAWPGARSGYLIEHDGRGVQTVDGWDVRPYRAGK